ncbi:hypothetical protein DFP72DRAFT_1070163 [Ephemerocybe angulata]|uniref:Uncharacterized protein n=1 Tax=Ephemerocybe angulata TaxID=980116 RepID=A0A8H6HTN0_9AGAR|nr:hypothetical protein DFP72DRAFT_1070163 [Tulosesus angulatus]
MSDARGLRAVLSARKMETTNYSPRCRKTSAQPKPHNSTTTSQTTTTEREPKISFKEGDSSKKEFAPISHSDMGNILYHFSAAIFSNGPERVVREKDFFHWIVLDYLDQPRDVWQMSLFAGLLLLQRYRAINTLRGKNSTSHTLLSAFPLDAVVFSVAMMGLQYCVADKAYKAVGIDKSMDHRRGTHESCKLAMLRGLEWNMHIGGKDLEKFRKDVIGAGLDASVHRIIVNQPLGFYGGPSRETFVLDGRMWSIVHDLDEANVYGDGAEARDQTPQGIKDIFSTLICRAVGYN